MDYSHAFEKQNIRFVFMFKLLLAVFAANRLSLTQGHFITTGERQADTN